MNRLLAIFLILIVNSAQAQDAPRHENGDIISKLKQKLVFTDSSLRNSAHDLTSVVDSTKLPKAHSSRHKLDSLKNILRKKRSSVSVVTDSLQDVLDLPSDEINEGISEVLSRTDSLIRKAGHPIEDVENKLREKQSSLQNRVNTTEEEISGKITNTENVLQEKVTKVTDDELRVPGNPLQIPDLGANLPTPNFPMHQSLPKIYDLDANMPKPEIPGTDDLKIPDAKLDVKGLNGKTNLGLPDMDKVDDLSGEINKIDGKLTEAQGYEEELQEIKANGIQDAEKLPDVIENKAENLDEMKALNAGKQKATEYQDIIQQYKNKKLLQEEIKRKATQVVNDKFNKLSPTVKNAQKQIAKAKKLNPAIQSFKAIIKKRPNEMKGKPFRQRFVPGITVQTYNDDKFAFDGAVQAGYRFSGRLTLGLGYTYRISIDERNVNWVSGEGISGYRVYTNFRLLKSFYAHGELEALSLDRTKQPALLETSQDVVYGSYFGLGKRYSISRKVKGTIEGLYRVDYKGSVPGPAKVSLRVGLDLDLKKQKKRKY